MTDSVPDSRPAEPAPAAPAPAVKRGTDWWAEAKGIVWLLLIVLGFHSFIAKPFYIPSESMLPGLLVGDRLVVTKFAYGWSFVSPTIPNPVGIFDSLVLHKPESWAVTLPPIKGRLFGRLPERGDVVIVTPPGTNSDYIKRVIGLPGDTLAVRGGTVYLNGVPVKRGPLHYVDVADYGGVIAPDDKPTCEGQGIDRIGDVPGHITCRLPVVTETLPGGRHFDTVKTAPAQGDEYPGPYPSPEAAQWLTPDRQAIRIPPNRVFLMGDNRENSADSRFPLSEGGLGGPVPYENLGGRAEFITFSLDGTTSLNPLTWFSAFRGGRAGTSLHASRNP